MGRVDEEAPSPLVQEPQPPSLHSRPEEPEPLERTERPPAPEPQPEPSKASMHVPMSNSILEPITHTNTYTGETPHSLILHLEMYFIMSRWNKCSHTDKCQWYPWRGHVRTDDCTHLLKGHSCSVFAIQKSWPRHPAYNRKKPWRFLWPCPHQTNSLIIQASWPPSADQVLCHKTLMKMRDSSTSNRYIYIYIYIGMGTIKVLTVLLLLPILLIDPVLYLYSYRYFVFSFFIETKQIENRIHIAFVCKM